MKLGVLGAKNIIIVIFSNLYYSLVNEQILIRQTPSDA